MGDSGNRVEMTYPEDIQKRIFVWKGCDVSTWNYRVIEFVTPSSGGMSEDTWRAIHEVYYDENRRPNGYTESPAVVGWHTDERESAPLTILERMRDALNKPVLTESDFHTEHAVINTPDSTRKSE